MANSYAGRSHASTGMVAGLRRGLEIGVEAPGLDELIRKLQQYATFGDTDAKRVRSGMQETVKIVYGEAQNTVPFRTGELKSTLDKKVNTWQEGNVDGKVFSNARSYRGNSARSYGPVVPFVLEGGRRPNKNGNMAITPRRWLYHAYSRHKEEISALWIRVMNPIVTDLAGKTG